MIRRVIATIGLSALAFGCDAPDEHGDLPEPPEAGEATFQMGPGLYAVGDETTEYARTRIRSDGTYVDMTREGEEVGSGTWTTRSDMICFDPAGSRLDQAERCWTHEGPREDSSFAIGLVGGNESYRVTRIEE